MNKKDKVYFNIAKEIASLSKDQNTQVGAVIIDKDGKVVSMGYNGCASNFGVSQGKDDSIVPHTREDEIVLLNEDYHFLPNQKSEYKINKYPFMIHAEQNALLTTSDMNRLKGATVYCTTFPCTTCANLLAQTGVKNLKVLDDVRHGTFEETIIPTLFVYENMGMKIETFKTKE